MAAVHIPSIHLVYHWTVDHSVSTRYSTTVSRLTGSNTVSVLATLFLLSYAKLLRTTLDAFSPITITDPNNTDHLRWLLDGNYGFLQWPHLAIFLVALLVLVTHRLPFTALLLLGPILQAHTNHRALRWVTRIKPFLDAYTMGHTKPSIATGLDSCSWCECCCSLCLLVMHLEILMSTCLLL